jgi:mono/diheme cytochrome c family protein
MKTLKQILIISVVLIFGITVTSFGQQAKPWEVPVKFKTMKNPVKSDDASIKAGRDLYNKNCAACHGKTGLGDGPKVKGLKTSPGNFTKAEYQNQSDADQFYKIKTGRGEMTKYEGKIDDTGIWQLVNFLRTLKK